MDKIQAEKYDLLDLSNGSRKVYRVGEYVVKVGRLGGENFGKKQNREEARIWNGTMAKTHRAMLAEVVDISEGGEVVVQRYYEPDPYSDTWEKEHPTASKSIERVCRKLHLADVSFYWPRNWFFHKGKPLIYDYGV
jgi:hypothetical protein